MNDVTITEIKTPEEMSSVALLAKEIWEEHYIPLIGPDQVAYMLEKFQSPLAIRNQIEKEQYHYYFLAYNGKRAGYLAIKPEKKTLFLSKFYIAKAFRGKGIGKVARDFLVQYAKDHWMDTVWLTVAKENETSIAIYKKLGFAIVRDINTDIGNGYYMDDYVMEIDV